MKEFIEKLIGRLEELYARNDKTKKMAYEEQDWEKFDLFTHRCEGIYSVISIVNQLAEEYNNESVNGDLISRSSLIKELNGIYLDNPWDNKEDILEKAIGIVDHFPTAYNNGWISCSERLPELYQTVLIQYHSKVNGFDKIVLAHIDSFVGWKIEFGGACDSDCVIAWQPLPAPYQPKGE